MKKTIILGLCSLLFMGSSCKETIQQEAAGELIETVGEPELVSEVCLGPFAHNVYIWLNQPQNMLQRKEFLKNLRKLAEESEYIQTYHIGEVFKSERDVVDDSFTFSWVVTFASIEDQEAYQTEPAHLEFIETTSKLWKKVLVYDSYVYDWDS